MNAFSASQVLIVCSTFFAISAKAQVAMPSTTRVGINELAALAQKHPDAKELTERTQGYYPTALVHGRCMVGFLGKVNAAFDPSGVDDAAISIGSRKGDIISFRIDAYHLDAMNGIAGLAYAELAGKAARTLDKLVKAIHADSVHAGINLPQPYTGKNVLIGITDWGFDYTHPMFYDTTLTETRIRAAWDQYRQAGPAPSAFGYGSEFTTPTDLLAAQSDTANIYSFATHGSHVAGIAGGSGIGTPYRGVAFEAKYLFCTFLVDAAAVLDAFTWMQDIAEQDQKRLVINMSWGLYWIGTLDGNSLISQAIDQFSQEGVVFVNSGGNNGDVNFHIKKDFAGDSIRSLLQFYPYSANPNMWGQSISMWGTPGETFSAGFTITTSGALPLQQSPWYATDTQPAYLDSFMVQGNDTVFFNLTAEAAHPLNGRPHFRLRVKSTSSVIRIALKATAPSGLVHFWNVTELTNDVGNWGEGFQAAMNGWTSGDKLYGISEPACTQSLITVAAYSSEYVSPGGTAQGGTIAPFSSYGPTLDERIKPDITAPGVNVASSISSFTDNAFTSIGSVNFGGRIYPWARFSGTSMAAPAVTGVVALMLEADPTLTPQEVKEVIKLTARTDAFTGVIPPGGSTRWGMGKVNAYRAVVELLGITGLEEEDASGFAIWPNPASSVFQVASDIAAGPVQVKVTDAMGRMVYSQWYSASHRIVIDAGAWPVGMYMVQVVQGDRASVTKLIKE